MEAESFVVMQNFETDDLSLSSADLNTIIQVPTLEPFNIGEENELQKITALDVSEIQTDLLENLDHVQLYLECDDDGNYDMPGPSIDTNVLPTALVGKNVSLRISFSNNMNIKQEKDAKCKFTCSVCHEGFKFQTKFQKHMLNIHQISNPFNCAFCKYTASSQKLLFKHLKGRHSQSKQTENRSAKPPENNNEINTTCKGSDKVEIDSGESLIVNKIDSGELLNVTRVSKSKDKGISSESKSCNQSTKSIFKCEKCNYTCLQKRSFDLHLKRHQNRFDFQCEVCSKKFLSSTALKRHIKTHQELRQFKCQVENCGKSFKIHGALSDHERYVHRNFLSSKIEADHEQTKLSSHQLNEADRNSSVGRKRDKKFKCTFDDCDKCFRDSYNLNMHLAAHFGHKEQKCPLCNFTSVQKASINWHIKSKHNKTMKI